MWCVARLGWGQGLCCSWLQRLLGPQSATHLAPCLWWIAHMGCSWASRSFCLRTSMAAGSCRCPMQNATSWRNSAESSCKAAWRQCSDFAVGCSCLQRLHKPHQSQGPHAHRNQRRCAARTARGTFQVAVLLGLSACPPGSAPPQARLQPALPSMSGCVVCAGSVNIQQACGACTTSTRHVRLDRLRARDQRWHSSGAASSTRVCRTLQAPNALHPSAMRMNQRPLQVGVVIAARYVSIARAPFMCAERLQ